MRWSVWRSSWNRFHVSVEGLPELSGAEDAVHQLIASFSSSWQLPVGLSLTGRVDVGLQSFGGDIERDVANLWTLDYPF